MHKSDELSIEMSHELAEAARMLYLKNRKDEIKYQVYHMSMRELRRELLKYKFHELEHEKGV